MPRLKPSMTLDRLYKALLLPGVLLTALAAGHGTQGAPWSVPCLFDTLLDIDCWGCGITRAVISLLHGEWQRAWDQRSMAIPVMVAIAAISLREYFALFQERQVRGS